MLFLCEQRGEPEQQGATENAEANEVYAVDAVEHGVFAYRGHQSPAGACTKHAQVCDEWLFFVIHEFSFFNERKISNKKLDEQNLSY